MMKIPKRCLLAVAGAVWLLAGVNILRIGLEAGQGKWTLWMLAAALATYLVFHNAIFRRLVKKHTKRIAAYEAPRQSVFLFFDKGSYLIMACMMTVGIGLRVLRLWPEVCIASFYAGLGASLMIAGVSFCVQYFRASHA